MGEWLYSTIYQADRQTAVASNVFVQIEKVNAREAVEYQGGDPHFTYHCYTRKLPTTNVSLVQQKFYVVDQQHLDPVTNQLRTFLIISDPHVKTIMMAWEWFMYRYRGT